METQQQRLQYLRDRRLSGNPYRLNGLEKIPDEEPCENGNGNGNSNEEECFVMVEEECEDDENCSDEL